jgi:hypothetical protein
MGCRIVLSQTVLRAFCPAMTIQEASVMPGFMPGIQVF